MSAQVQLQPTVSSRAVPAQSTTASPKQTLDEQLQADPNSPQDETVHFERIAQLAYSYWQGRGCPFGSPEQDWFTAEQQLQLTRLATEVARS